MPIHRCNLDDFITQNYCPIIVDGYSKPIIFHGINYIALPGAEYHLEVLQGNGFQLKEKYVGRDTLYLESAYILDKDGHHTGFGFELDVFHPKNKRPLLYSIKDKELMQQGLKCHNWEDRYRQASRLKRLNCKSRLLKTMES